MLPGVSPSSLAASPQVSFAGSCNSQDSVTGYFPRTVTKPSFAGADLKEREQMNDAEVGVCVQRLRGLMNEIGEGPGMEWGEGGHSGALVIPATHTHPPTIL